jgi:hypothetical protein
MPGLPLATIITLKNLTGKLKTQVIGHGARTNNVNTLEGRQGFEIAELIKTLVPKDHFVC